MVGSYACFINAKHEDIGGWYSVTPYKTERRTGQLFLKVFENHNHRRHH